MTNNKFLDFISERRSVYPQLFDSSEITMEEVRSLLELARWAPNHKNTQPWNFVVFYGNAKERLAKAQFESLETTPESPEMLKAKQDKLMMKATQCGAVIAIIMKRNAALRVPEWEEMAAVACAVQNIWLGASKLGLGGYWGSGGATNSPGIRTLLKLEPNDLHLGWFHVGRFKGEMARAENRKTVEQFTSFVSE